MDFNDLIIKIADAKDDTGLAQECLDYAISEADTYSESEQQYLLLILNQVFDDLITREKAELIRLQNRYKMQHKKEDYNEQQHEMKKALTVKNPYAEWIAQGVKTIEVRSRSTKHRGELVICSSQQPEIQGMQSGCMLCLVNLYDVKPLEKLTPQEWELTKIPVAERKGLTGFGWMLKDPVRIVEYPVKGQLGIWNLVMDRLEFIPYNSAEIKAYNVEAEEVGKYDRKAVKKGCLVLFVIFVLGVAAVLLIIAAVWALFW
ncbi:hypothetical protein B620_gp65 [Croceibacter phage P2559S]|uniref:hypothetical protein n=1 Tax=Croceibacter phage P2559S TaxID=1176422 RepID=UPI0002688F27|nr:hypothetical protein B620_gp65 [Croceibacter phage P2559S]AFM54843.1 hypothetical protein P2559S_65 [Croceibacter phage P2559S]